MHVIKINGQEYPVRFSFKFCKAIANKLGCKTLTELLNKIGDLPLDKYPEFIYEGLKLGAQKNDEKLNLILGDVEEALDNDFTLFNQCAEILTAAITGESVEKLRERQAAQTDTTEIEGK